MIVLYIPMFFGLPTCHARSLIEGPLGIFPPQRRKMKSRAELAHDGLEQLTKTNVGLTSRHLHPYLVG